ncbi:DUF2895 family protein [Vibrio sp. Y2-5]|uniref:DUF2895 family protein n=1 Tax=Vibrio sp. Y2-5 TaxID=2743977 RepID=UPI0016611DF0|nr:DUF2895 family protein [Vibrio sp. Y2-5]MBD0788034.1 DUF2895 family protein [Vibrio sp. Y2-5]
MFKKNQNPEEAVITETETIDLVSSKEFDENEIPLSKRIGKLPKIMVQKTHEHLSHVATLRFMIALLVCLLFMSMYTTSQMPKRILVKISPQMQSGLTMKIGEYPKSAILSDIQFLWLDMNNWDKSGDDQAIPLVDRYQYFLSPEFQVQLKEKYEEMSRKGALNRTRLPSAVPGQLFQFEDRVIQVSKDSWKVFLDIKIEERMDGELVRSPTYRYFFLVERFESNLDYNPLGLRIVGYSDEPKRIKD